MPSHLAADHGWLGHEPTFDVDRFPLHICAYDYDEVPGQNLTDDHVAVLKEAIKMVNVQLGGGHELFILATTSCDVYMLLSAPEHPTHPDAAGVEWFEEAEGQDICMISTHGDMRHSIHKSVIEHELGHCMGLEHDGIMWSIMYPSVIPANARHPQIFTERDRELILGRYFSN